MLAPNPTPQIAAPRNVTKRLMDSQLYVLGIAPETHNLRQNLLPKEFKLIRMRALYYFRAMLPQALLERTLIKDTGEQRLTKTCGMFIFEMHVTLASCRINRTVAPA